jgi:hypothetical protein
MDLIDLGLFIVFMLRVEVAYVCIFLISGGSKDSRSAISAGSTRDLVNLSRALAMGSSLITYVS